MKVRLVFVNALFSLPLAPTMHILIINELSDYLGFGTAMITDIKYDLQEFDTLKKLKTMWPPNVCKPRVVVREIRRKKGPGNLVGT